MTNNTEGHDWGTPPDDGGAGHTATTEQHEQGTVFAYRGSEQHGVPMTGTPDLLNVWDDDNPAVPDLHEPAPLDPIPVLIVNPTPENMRQIVKFRTGQTFLSPGVPQQILGRDRARLRVTLRNRSAGTDLTPVIWIAQAANLANAQYGYPLFPDVTIGGLYTRAESLTLSTDNAIVAMLDPASSLAGVYLATITEWVQDDE